MPRLVILLLGLLVAALAAGTALAEVPPTALDAARYRSFSERVAAERDGAAAAGAAGVTSTAGVQAEEDPPAADPAGTLPGGIRPEQALGQDVYGRDGTRLAEIEDLLLDDDGKVVGVVLAGEDVAAGAPRRAVPVTQLRAASGLPAASGGETGESKGAAGVTGAAGPAAGTGPGASDLDAPGMPGLDRPQLVLELTQGDLARLPSFAQRGEAWVREGS